jgi:hypothetical protein
MVDIGRSPVTWLAVFQDIVVCWWAWGEAVRNVFSRGLGVSARVGLSRRIGWMGVYAMFSFGEVIGMFLDGVGVVEGEEDAKSLPTSDPKHDVTA